MKHELLLFFVRLRCQVLREIVIESYVSYFGYLHPAFEMSCDTEHLLQQPLIFWKSDLRRFVMCAIVLMIFVQTFRKKLGCFSESKTQTFQNDVEYVPKMSF